MSPIFLNLNDEPQPDGAPLISTEQSAETFPSTAPSPADWAMAWFTPWTATQSAGSALPAPPMATPAGAGGDGPTTGDVKPPPPPTTPGVTGPLPVISMVDRVVSEKDGFVDLVFTLSAPAKQVVTADWTAAGSATGGGGAGSDFGAISGSLSFAVGESTKTVRITLTDDSVDEVTESFALTLGNPVNASLQRSQTLVTIVDNDGVSGTPVITVRDAIVDEAAGTASFSVSLDRPSTGTVTVDYDTAAGTATAGSDFTAGSGTLSFSAGQTVRTVTVAIGNDSVAEVAERFNLLLSGASGATVGDAVGTAIIGANDQAAAALPQITVSDTRVSEGDGYVELVFVMSAPSAGVASVAWSTAAGSALAGSDYKTSTGTLSFLPGQTTATLRLDIMDSATVESTEAFSLTLSAAVNATLARSTVGISLVDDDGARVLSYGLGDDSYVVTAATDVIVENTGGGNDLVTATVSYVLGDEVENLTLGGSSAINGTGNGLANRITGNSGNNVIDGGAGNDTMAGGAGNDSYVVASTGDVVTEASGGGTADKVTSSIAWTLGAEIEMLTLSGTSSINGTGNTLANTITGNSGNNSLNGGSGNDTLNGGTGNDSLVGSTGNDSYTVDSSTDVISETTTVVTEIDSVTSSVAWTLGSYLENLTLTGSTAINGTGNTLANTLTGNTGNNLLFGNSGNDTISGGAGNDSLDGGTGNDSLDGGTGNDSLVGSTGNDSYTVDSSTDVISETTTVVTEIDSVSSSVAWTLGSYLENLTLTGSSSVAGAGNTLANTLTGNTGNNLLFGNSGNDTISGGAGNDSLDGGTGNDLLVGGTGNDIYTVDSAGDIVSETSTVATEIDSVSSSVNLVLGSNLEKLTLTGSAAINGTGNSLANTITGNTGSNMLSGRAGNDTLIGDAGNDSLDGGTGNDSMAGGTGNDSYTVDSSSDLISETSTLATEIDSVFASATFTLGTNLEFLSLTGAAAINGTGNALNNTITGNTGANVLSGLGGNDVLTGGEGADTFRFASTVNGTTNVDVITDFVKGEDRIELENGVFTSFTTTTGVLSAANFVASSTGVAVDSNDYVLYETDTGKLFYDADGSGSAASVLIATLSGAPALANTDIFLT